MSNLEKLQPKHLHSFVDFRHLSSKESVYVNTITEARAEAVIAEYAESDQKQAFVLTDDDRIVGQLFLSLLPKLFVLRIDLISVLSEQQGKGTASKLMQKAVEVAKAEKALHIQLFVHRENNRAIRFYQKQHFEFLKKHSHTSDIYQLNIAGKSPKYSEW